MLGAGMMSGGMLAVHSLNNLNEDDDDLKWLSEIIASGKAKLGQGEVSAITLGCALGLMIILGCCWTLIKNKKKTEECEEGTWTWKRMEKTEEEIGEKESQRTEDRTEE